MLEVKALSKTYKKKVALEPIGFTLENGVYALLGPNGAGKSTLMNLLTDNLKADSGAIFWNGIPIRELGRDYRRILGYAPQQQGLYEDFTARDFLSYLAVLKEIPKSMIMAEVERVAGEVDLVRSLDQRLGGFSGGMKQRILIAQALLGNPQLLILDEPTAGLDPKERIRLRNLCRRLSEDKILLVSTHVVSDIESIAREILLLKQGRLLAKKSVADLIAQFAPGRDLETVYLKLFGDEDEGCC